MNENEDDYNYAVCKSSWLLMRVKIGLKRCKFNIGIEISLTKLSKLIK